MTAPDEDEMVRRMLAVLDAENNRIHELAEIAGLDRAMALRGADLRGVVFDEDDDLSGFRLRDADLRGADLRRARGVSAEVLAGAIVDAMTLLPGRRRPFPPRDALLRWHEPLPGLPEVAWPDMVTLPARVFTMGAPKGEEGSGRDERPQREVTVRRPFALGRTAVTFAMWDAARAAGADLREAEDEGWGREQRPVINVSWDDAQAYCAWLNARLGLRPGTYRLPSEAEWEYACRAGTVTPFSFGETISPEQVNYDGNFTYGRGRKGVYRERTVPVGELPGNAWGLHEMHGNAWEWCEDAYGPYPAHATDSRPLIHADSSPRVLRGGSWLNNPWYCRSAQRLENPSDYRGSNVGFRLARTLF